jgi:hypothetical protein
MLLALLVGACVAGLLGGREAFAGAHTSASAVRVRITGNRIVGLYPGATKALILTLRNLDPRRGVLVRNIRVRDIATSSRRCPPARGNLRFRQYSGPAIRIPARGARIVKVLVWMPNPVADGCKRVLFTLRYSAETLVQRRRGSSIPANPWRRVR